MECWFNHSSFTVFSGDIIKKKSSENDQQLIIFRAKPEKNPVNPLIKESWPYGKNRFHVSNKCFISICY